MNQPDLISKRRSEFRKQFAGGFYNAYLNLFLVIVVFALCLIVPATQITWKISTLVFIAIGFLYSDAMFYFAHRFQQHKKVPLQEWAFEMHAFWHHGMFSSDRMHIESAKDINMVVLPFFVHGGVLGIIYLPIAIIAEWYFGSDLGWVLMFSVAAHLLWYEIVHTLSHRKNPVYFKKLTEHHKAHHNPELMGKCNFGIATTLFDKVFKTQHSEP